MRCSKILEDAQMQCSEIHGDAQKRCSYILGAAQRFSEMLRGSQSCSERLRHSWSYSEVLEMLCETNKLLDSSGLETLESCSISCFMQLPMTVNDAKLMGSCLNQTTLRC